MRSGSTTAALALLGLVLAAPPARAGGELPSYDEVLEDVTPRAPLRRRVREPLRREPPRREPLRKPAPDWRPVGDSGRRLELEWEGEREAERVAPTARELLSTDAKSRAAALRAKIIRERAPKFGAGFEWEFNSSVSDLGADEFARWRLPLYLDMPGPRSSRVRVTGTPTVVDNGLVDDSGFAVKVEIFELPLVSDSAVTFSGGVGSSPIGFPDDPDVLGFVEVNIRPRRSFTLTPFYQRRPVVESLLSYRGHEIPIPGQGQTLFFGKVVEDRVGGRLLFTNPDTINGSLEGALSRVTGENVKENQKFDAFVGLGRTFRFEDERFSWRPGAQVVLFHYDSDLSAPRPPSGGYFSPDFFVEATARIDFAGPFLEDMLPGSRFVAMLRGGFQSVSGVDEELFEGAEGSRGIVGIGAELEIPLGEIATLHIEGSHLSAEPYDRSTFAMYLEFPFWLEHDAPRGR